MNKVCVILLAGGQGTRMKMDTPKQYVALQDKPIALHSFEVFCSLSEVCEIVVVCDQAYRPVFEYDIGPVPLTFAKPGERRQDSVFSGLEAVTTRPDLICIHDSARPLISTDVVKSVIEAADQHGAASVGVPIRFTIKECDENHFVRRTPDRSFYWEIQTPQIIRPDLLKKGFALAQQEQLTVTDDVSLVELLDHPVKIVEGDPRNIKVTVKEDFQLLKALLEIQNSPKMNTSS